MKIYSKIWILVLLSFTFLNVSAQDEKPMISLYEPSPLIMSDSISILIIPDKTIDQPVRILIYPHLNLLRSIIKQIDPHKGIERVIIHIRIKESGEIQLVDIYQKGNGNLNVIKEKLMPELNFMAINADYNLLIDSLDITIPIKMNY
jgi:hypothetical protein